MLSVLNDGRKLTPFIILKRKNLSKENPTGIIFKCNERGWMMEELLMIRWLERSLAQKKTRCSSKEKRNDSFRFFQGSRTEKMKTVASNPLNTDLMIIPGSMTF
jgi:hypothetical protein